MREIMREIFFKNFFSLVLLSLAFLVGCAPEATTEPGASAVTDVLIYDDDNVISRTYNLTPRREYSPRRNPSFVATGQKISAVSFSNAVVTGTKTKLTLAEVNMIPGVEFSGFDANGEIRLSDSDIAGDTELTLPVLTVEQTAFATNITIWLHVEYVSGSGNGGSEGVEIKLNIAPFLFNDIINNAANIFTDPFLTGEAVVAANASGSTATGDFSTLVTLLQSPLAALNLTNDLIISAMAENDAIKINLGDATNGGATANIIFTGIPDNDTPADVTNRFTIQAIGKRNAAGMLTLRGELIKRGTAFTPTPIDRIGFLADGGLTNVFLITGAKQIPLAITNPGRPALAAPRAMGQVNYTLMRLDPNQLMPPRSSTDVIFNESGNPLSAIVSDFSGKAVTALPTSTKLGIGVYTLSASSGNTVYANTTSDSEVTILSGRDIASSGVESSEAHSYVKANLRNNDNNASSTIAIGNVITSAIGASGFSVIDGEAGGAFSGFSDVTNYIIRSAADEGGVAKSGNNVVITSTAGNSTLFAYVLSGGQIATVGGPPTRYKAIITATVSGGDANAKSESGFLVQTSTGMLSGTTSKVKIAADAGKDKTFTTDAFEVENNRSLVVVALAKEGVEIRISKVSIQPQLPMLPGTP